jgi:peptide/nickel transport system permease protein
MTTMADSEVTGSRGGAPSRLADRPWLSFAGRRFIRFVVSVWVLISAVFAMIHLVPGDPVRAALGMTAPVELVEARRRALGLTEPLWEQYLRYLVNVVTGHLGTSLTMNLPVSQVIRDRLPATVSIALPAFVLVLAAAIPLGALMAVLTQGGRRRGSELAFTASSVVLAGIPEFLLAVCLVYVFAVRTGWFRVAGRGGLDSYVLPVISLSAAPAAVLARIVRVEMLAVLDNDFIRTARAKRLRPVLIYVRHGLPNALTATLTLGGLMLTGLGAGTVLVENVFAWPGLGSTIVQSIQQRDYPLVQGIALVYGISVLLISVAVDVLLALIDPRSTIREG